MNFYSLYKLAQKVVFPITRISNTLVDSSVVSTGLCGSVGNLPAAAKPRVQSAGVRKFSPQLDVLAHVGRESVPQLL